MPSFENFVKSMPPSLSELKVTPSFCFAFKIPDDHALTNIYKLYEIFTCFQQQTDWSSKQKQQQTYNYIEDLGKDSNWDSHEE